MAGPGTEERLFRRYAVCADGTRVVQSTAPGLVRAVVESAEVRAGQRVLEVGTGSGYSTAVLAQIVGPAGHVVSLDVNQALAERARDLLRADGLRQVEVHCQDARTELPGGGPFDRVIAWATSPAVPGPGWPRSGMAVCWCSRSRSRQCSAQRRWFVYGGLAASRTSSA